MQGLVLVSLLLKKTRNVDLDVTRQKHIEGLPIAPGVRHHAQVEATAAELLDGPSSQSKYRGIPSAPFLVASVIEALAAR